MLIVRYCKSAVLLYKLLLCHVLYHDRTLEQCDPGARMSIEIGSRSRVIANSKEWCYFTFPPNPPSYHYKYVNHYRAATIPGNFQLLPKPTLSTNTY